jgi:hypothetical protein
VLAAEVLSNLQLAQRSAPQWPQKQRLAGRVGGHHDERRHSPFGPDVALPQLKEVVTLIGGGKAGDGFEPPPGRLAGRQVLEYLHAGDADIRGRRAKERIGARAQRKHCHGAAKAIFDGARRLAKICQ